jgi:deoxyribodipyrimidine photolyase-related protein
MTIGIWVLGDQLWSEQAALLSCYTQREKTPVILIESDTYVRQRVYHRQKLVLIWSAMRHFAEELRSLGWQVTYEIADDFQSPLENWVKKNQISQVRVMYPSDRPFVEIIRNLKLNCQINFVPNNLFLWNVENFKKWATPRKRLLMEDFYREGRKHFNVLMAGKEPVGGKWNFDRQNRQPPKGKLKTPEALWFEPDEITQAAIAKVKSGKFSSYGKLEPFRWGVTRNSALKVLEYFVEKRLSTFGPYQDAMITGEETMWHAMISPYLNLGLIQPMEVINAVEQAYQKQGLDLNSIEGFIRQVMGWREYMHGIYHVVESDYFQRNWLNHTLPLPEFYWDASKTDMNCLHQVLTQVERTSYAHHIQRLMVLNNFALIAGVKPQEIENWFHGAFIDAYDWVMQTNVIGMGQFADGGIVASKPYASSANYINKMSDYCKNCAYKSSDRTGEKACPFNFFYWDFLARHRDKLKSLGRMNMVLANLERISQDELEKIRTLARNWQEKLGEYS